MPKPAHGYDKPLTEKGKLSDRGRAKLEGQIVKAESIMRTEGGTYGRERTKAYHQAKRMRDRARELLGKKSSPDKKSSQKPGDKHAKRREPFEKATGTDRIKKALVGVAKRAEQANR